MSLAPQGTRARSRGRQAGAVAVEFALILPVLVMLMFGIITSGLAYSDHLSVTNAVREAARLGSAVDYSTGSGAWGDSVQTRVRQVYMNGTGTLNTGQICVQLVNDAGVQLAAPTSQGSCGTAPTSPSGMASGSCAVKVWVEKPSHITILVAADLNFKIRARSVSYYGRSAGLCTAS